MPISAEVVNSLRAKFAAAARTPGAARSRVQERINELEVGTAGRAGIRTPGAGHRTLTEKDPGLRPALSALV